MEACNCVENGAHKSTEPEDIQKTLSIEPKFTDLELEHPVEGDITIPGAQDEDVEISTLDEPVKDTIMRDVNAVGIKFFHVLYPKQSKSLLKEWDLWGPLILCTLLAILLHMGNDSSSCHTSQTAKDKDPKECVAIEFSQVFGLVAFGAVVVALNSRLLGGMISFFQCVCVLGYCMLPMIISLIIGKTLHLINSSWYVLTIKSLIAFAAFIWSALGALAFVSDSQPQHRKVLALYPICLFYFVIFWMVVTG